MRCCVENCSNDTKNTNKSDGVTFHMFPKEESARSRWEAALGLRSRPAGRSAVCSLHFRTADFCCTRGRVSRLRAEAVPTLQPQDPVEMDASVLLLSCRICLRAESGLQDLHQLRLYHVYTHLLRLGSVEDPPVAPPDKGRVCRQCAGRLRGAERLARGAAAAHTLLHHKQSDVKTSTLDRSDLLQPLVPWYWAANHCDVSIAADDEEEPRVPVQPIHQVELVKEEQQNNEIFLEEYNQDQEDIRDDEQVQDTAASDSEDDKKLSEITFREPPPPAPAKKKRREKKTKTRKHSIKKVENDDPETVLDKYRTSDVRRRRTQDALDESLFTITSLTYEEQITEVRARQQSAAYIAAPYRCELCYRGFQLRERYLAHEVRHSQESGPFECFICRTRLKSSRALRKHLTAQHTEKFACKGCPFVTRNRGVAREHERWHAGTKYRCPHCVAEFDKLTTYMGHIRIKHVSDFVCNLCGFTFVSRKGIDVHKKKKHRAQLARLAEGGGGGGGEGDGDGEGEGPYCEACDVRFVSREAHDRHLKLSARHSSDTDPNRIRNDSQSMHSEGGGGGRRGRGERRASIYPRGEGGGGEGAAAGRGPVTCEQCGIQLRDLRLYAQHFRRAHPDKNRTKYPAMKTPCMCEHCGRIFQSMALLKDHMWVHTGEKRFKCDRCDKSFTQKTNLAFHLRVHQDARPTFECPLCGKSFAFFNNRRRHMFIHTGLKPHKCDVCGKTFTTGGELRAHHDHVHLKKPWPKRQRATRPAQWPKCAEE